MGLLLPLMVIGGYFAAKKYGNFDALSADSWKNLGDGAMRDVTLHALGGDQPDSVQQMAQSMMDSSMTNQPAASLQTPVSAAPVSGLQDAPGSPVTTQATGTEGQLQIRLVYPPYRPNAPGAQADQYARGNATRLESMLVKSTDGARYVQNDPALVQALKSFQSVLGLESDGVYGPATAGALMYYLGHAPPPPLSYGPDGSGERVIYFYSPM